jgi:two-component system response regulator GlrR
MEESGELGRGRPLLPRHDATEIQEAERGTLRVGRRRDDRIVAASPAFQRVLDLASSAARSELPVLVWGSPGTGKTLVARAIHAWSRRASEPLEIVLCVGIPQPLQGRELFGCVAGAFPALPEAYAGACERAEAGTLLVEGLEALSGVTCEALQRALASRRYRTVGSSAERALEARIVVTARSAKSPVFGDLPHHEIELPPLADRPEDVLPLAAHFLATCAEEAGLKPVGFTADARAALLDEPWPGNAAELRERVRHAMRLSADGTVASEALALAAREGERVPSFREAKRAFETRYVTGLLRRCDGNISRAARLAKKDRKDFYDVIRRTGVDPTQFRR